MRRRVHSRGLTIVELLAGLALGLAVAALLASTTAVGTRALARLALRAEAEDIAQLAVEAFAFDVRRAGLDPAGTGIQAITLSTDARVTLQADLDQDGLIDGASEETTTWVCNLGTRKLSRVIGSQSLPVADDVVVCLLAYADATGAPLAAAGAGLDAVDRGRVRRIALDVAIRPPGSSASTARRVTIALRGPS